MPTGVVQVAPRVFVRFEIRTPIAIYHNAETKERRTCSQDKKPYVNPGSRFVCKEEFDLLFDWDIPCSPHFATSADFLSQVMAVGELA
jgi:hypothetical protein